jgi:hypothetical protein
MNTNSNKTRPVSSSERFAGWAVVLLTLVALAAGWLLKSSVENRSRSFMSGSTSAQAPAGWLVLNPEGNEVLHITDRTSAGFGTTYLIQVEAVPADTQASQVASLITLERGNALTGYRVLNQQEVSVQGQPAIQIDYVYVESADNLNNAILPAVVHGLDYIFIKTGQAGIVSYRADQSVFETDLGRFNRFLVSVKF